MASRLPQPVSAVDHLLHLWAVALTDDLDCCSGVIQARQLIVWQREGGGDVLLEPMELAADPGQRLNIYTAEPGSPSHDALNLLASWTTTENSPRTSDR